jgi:hypothetical protein
MRFDRRANLSELRAQILLAIETQATDAHTLFVTPGQGAVYLLKHREALAIVADRQQGANLSGGETPHITAEAAEHGVSRFEKAVEILTLDRHWVNGSKMIETLRRSAKAALADAITAQEIRAAAVIDWRDVEAYARNL